MLRFSLNLNSACQLVDIGFFFREKKGKKHGEKWFVFATANAIYLSLPFSLLSSLNNEKNNDEK